MAASSTASHDTATQAAPAAPPKPAKHNLFARRKATKKGKEVAADTSAPPPEPASQPNGTSSEQEHGQEEKQSQPVAAAEGVTPETANPSTTANHDSPEGVDTHDSAGAGSQPGQDPATPQQESPAPAAATVSASASAVPSSAEPTTTPPVPPPAPSEQADEADREKEKDKGSLSTTLTGTQTHTRQSRRKGTQGASDGAHSSTTDPPSTLRTTGKQKAANMPARHRVSFFARLVHVLVPCVSPAQHPDALDIDTVAVMQDPTASIVEKLPLRDAEKESQPVQETPVPGESVSTHPPAEASSSIQPELKPLDVDADAPTPLSGDKEIVVPPTPTRHVLPQSETEGVTSGAVQPPGSTGEDAVNQTRTQHDSSGDESDGTSFTEDEDVEEGPGIDEVEDDEDRLIMNGGAGIPIGADGVPRPLLPPIAPHHAGRKCLVLDLDETLVHSSFKSIHQADYVVPVEIEYHWHNVYVIKRPGVDNFLKRMGEIYEIVVFTASLSKYADPVLDKLDVNRVVTHRLFRESCYNHKGNYVKDLSQLGRPISDTIILDNSPASYIFHPNNAVPVSSWFNDPHDTELTDLCPFLADLSPVDDVRGVLDGGL
ncbi:hypothetical protein EW146_g8995 [Bondarzewia mesenterica]|uniref:FCP1 homology domain-containing protein n=1 Tax=Bondarzewia mesenterica TaxID=1095465 RepID=A0A4S4LBC4_9AGAM|nr:hypothetical protein EW146_g8995 [Bondarzewia mesenterica]